MRIWTEKSSVIFIWDVSFPRYQRIRDSQSGSAEEESAEWGERGSIISRDQWIAAKSFRELFSSEFHGLPSRRPRHHFSDILYAKTHIKRTNLAYYAYQTRALLTTVSSWRFQRFSSPKICLYSESILIRPFQALPTHPNRNVSYRWGSHIETLPENSLYREKTHIV